MKQKIIAFYLDWVNNFISTDSLAEHYGITQEEASFLINMGRKYHEETVES